MGAVDYVKEEVQEADVFADPEDTSPGVNLTPEQEAVLHEFRSGRNVFFTGCAGTGKSLVLRKIIHWCHSEWRMKDSEVVVTAPTGMAAMNIGGSTIHSWAGIGLGLEPVEQLLSSLLGDTRSKVMNGDLQDSKYLDEPYHKLPRGMRRWLDCQVLIIDEISMLEGSLLDKLEAMGRFIKRDSRPFGGIQLVLSGDFLQLPPIGEPGKSPIFAFQSTCWNRCVGTPILLKTVFRQKGQRFIDCLNQLRVGNVTPDALEFFLDLARPIVYKDGIQPTELFSTKEEVQDKNTHELNKLSGPKQIFISKDKPGWEQKTRKLLSGKALESAYSRISVPQVLELKMGAQVMLLKNLVQRLLVNGSLGVVVGYCTARHAWESHGIYLGCAIGLSPLSGLSFSAGAARSEAEDELSKWLKDDRRWPVIRFFRGRSRQHTVDICCDPHLFTARHAGGGIAAFRNQIPLMLSYALTIHKAQGQTLERVKVDLARTFTAGQCYVALSRAVSVDALQVLHFDSAKVKADDSVIRYLDELGDKKRCPIDELLDFWDDMNVD